MANIVLNKKDSLNLTKTSYVLDQEISGITNGPFGLRGGRGSWVE